MLFRNEKAKIHNLASSTFKKNFSLIKSKQNSTTNGLNVQNPWTSKESR